MTAPRHRPARSLVVLALATAGLVAGCDGDPAQEGATPAEVLAQARTTLDESPGLSMRLAVDELPPGTDGLLSAEGVGNHEPAFRGTIQVAASGVNVDAEVVAVDGVVHAKLPFATRFVEIDPADYGAPDPAALLSTDTGLSSLLTDAEDVTRGEQVRDGDRVLSTFSGTVPGRTVARIIPSAEASQTFEATFTVQEEAEELTRVVVTGPFYAGVGDVGYTVDLADYGTEQDITAP